MREVKYQFQLPTDVRQQRAANPSETVTFFRSQFLGNDLAEFFGGFQVLWMVEQNKKWQTLFSQFLKSQPNHQQQ